MSAGILVRVHELETNKKKLVFTGVIVVIVLALVGVGIYRYNRPIPTLTVGDITVKSNDTSAAPVDIPWPNSGRGSLVTASGLSLGSAPGGDTVQSTASVAKVITIMTVLQKHPLKAGETGPTLTIGDSDVALYNKYYSEDGSNVEVQSGEQLTEYQMLEGMLLPSGNNIADSLAIWAYGSMGAYKTAAQNYVKSLGMTNTTIGSDASGFSADTTSTANDLAKLGVAAEKQPVVMEIAAKKSATLPVVGSVVNTNNALGEEGINGLKTGTSDEAGNCLLFTASHTFGSSQTVTFVGVVLGAVTEDSRFSVAEGLLDTAYENYTQVTIAKAGQSLGTVTSAWGAHADITPQSDLTAYTWLGKTDGVTSKKTLAGATSASKGQEVGSLSIDGQSVSLVTSDAISQPSFIWRIFH